MRTIFLLNFIEDESGATAIEYGFLVAFIAVLVAAVLPDIGSEIDKIFQSIVGFLNPDAP